MLKKFISYIDPLITLAKKSLILTHRQPDGDALGSCLAWMRFLQKHGCEVLFVSPTNITPNLSWLPYFKDAVSFEEESGKKKTESWLASTDLIFCLDFNALSRLEELGNLVLHHKAVKVMIDHHREPEDFANYIFSDTSYAATSEMIYDVISAMGKDKYIDEEMAELLYAGICTDTGFFQFNNTTPRSLNIAAKLVEKGARPDYVSEMVNNIFHVRRLRFFGFCLDKKLKLAQGGKVAYIMASSKEIKRYRLQNGDSEGLVNYPFKIKGVEMTALFCEESDRIKISFRSRGNNLDMNTFARTFFNGGGHFNAAGGKSFDSLEQTEINFLKALETLFPMQ
ncbi:MAG: bifunctional oligoribonuclease/PAP phosphatase NrnA [Chitinophagales bacterium]|nr:bifunctional oligoribonuclease/PAP phosphatase NrnA [Chitinophagales bacterium]MDW8273187.1 bifunctional oligoribonuclease/PAP phosphatase NrnA [Chitinophagales bacterium]